MTGGTGADEFRFESRTPATQSRLSGMDVVTDFQAADGDKLNVYPIGAPSLPAVFRGSLAAIDVSTGPTAGLVLPGSDLGTGFSQFWWIPALSGGAPAGGWLVSDSNNNFELNGDDFVVRVGSLANPVTITQADFVATNFVVQEGTPGPDSLTGGGGQRHDLRRCGFGHVVWSWRNDQLYGGAGNDSLDGGLASDQLFGDADNDTLQGGDGNDFLDGGLGSDTLEGGNDADDLRAAYSVNDLATDQNLLNGGAGNDSLFGSAGLDTLNGGTDNDSLNGGANADQLNGEDGNDILNGDSGDDALNGGAGLDTLYGGEGVDTMTGGTGADEFRFESRTPATQSRLSGMDVVTDFQAADGDKLNVYPFGGRAFRRCSAARWRRSTCRRVRRPGWCCRAPTWGRASRSSGGSRRCRAALRRGAGWSRTATTTSS